ncbi:MAG: 4Fe-4S dicluster domain-containing protein [Thermodesulforhabdaceae bacterium]
MTPAKKAKKKIEEKIFIPQEKLNEVLERLSKHFRVWVPVLSSSSNGWTVEFRPFTIESEPFFTRQSTMPPKSVILPQGETLFQYEYVKNSDDPSKQDLILKETINAEKTLVFGARPCDVRGFVICDWVFLRGLYLDVYYKSRRENTLFATLVCQDADDACFCSSVGGGPGDMEGSDIRITSTSEGFVLEGLNDRAKEVISLCECDPPSEEQSRDAQRIQEEAKNRIIGSLDVSGSVEAVKGQFQNMGVWRDIAESCLSCGVCTYVCPTCYCFTITDEIQGLKGERLRSWDSCMFHQYTQEASGHNPRPTKLERYRNRLGHKFCYFPLRYGGVIACCGCGRCIRSCPVSIDIRSAVERVKEVHSNACVCS